VETLIQDLRYAIRVLSKVPGFIVVAVLTLALGIGANTAVFSVVDSVLLQRLPYPDPARLVTLLEKQSKGGEMSLSWRNFADWHGQVHSFEADAATRQSTFTLSGLGPASRIHGVQVSLCFFTLLGTTPKLGRFFTDAEDAPSAAAVVVLAESFWRGNFRSDPKIIGNPIVLDGTFYTIIGVAPANLKYFSHVQVYFPIAPFSANPNWQNRGNHEGIRCLARLRSGVSLAQAQGELDAIMAHLEQQYPTSNAGLGAAVTSLEESMFHDSRIPLLLLLGAVGFVLLIACANVANLFLARAAGRQKEFAIRSTLGASNARLIRQLLTESVLLSIIGGGIGLLLANWLMEPLLHFAPQSVPRLADARMDLRVLLFTLIVSVTAGILFGLAPALHASHEDLGGTLKETGASVTSSHSRQRLRATLLIAEVALGTVLVIASGLMVRSMFRVMSVRPGVNPDHVLALDVYLSSWKYKEHKAEIAFFDQAIARIRELPGVKSAGGIGCTPFTGGCWGSVYEVGDRPIPPQSELPDSAFNVAGPGYFETMQIPLLEGRYFNASDLSQSRPVIVINATMARKWWPNESPIGKRIKQGFPQDDQPYREIVGVVGDVKEDGLDAPSRTEVYMPFTQQPVSAFTYMVRTEGAPMGIATNIVDAIQAMDPDQAVDNVEPMTNYLADSILWRKSVSLLLGFFGLLALGLAAIGIYGVMSYTVSQRSHEIGIRMALGAQPCQILRLVVGQGLRMALAGVAIGVAAALALMQLLASQLFGVTPRDPLTFAVAMVVLVGVAIAGSYMPARRAAKLDPMDALRYG
jgi:putative ABC transport system permease protein